MTMLLAVALLAGAPGITLGHPGAFHVTTQELTGSMTDPVERLALYSGPPPNGMVRPRAHQVIAIVMEQEPPVDLTPFPLRPRRFHIRRLTTLEGFSGPRWTEIIFRERGRAFYLFIGVGTGADRQIPGLLAALDSLRIR